MIYSTATDTLQTLDEQHDVRCSCSFATFCLSFRTVMTANEWIKRGTDGSSVVFLRPRPNNKKICSENILRKIKYGYTVCIYGKRISAVNKRHFPDATLPSKMINTQLCPTSDPHFLSDYPEKNRPWQKHKKKCCGRKFRVRVFLLTPAATK